MKNFCVIITLLAMAGSVQSAALDSVTEDFYPGRWQYLDISSAARTSADTGYAWSGHTRS